MPSLREAALLHDLLESYTTLEQCLQEASMYQMPYIVRCLFATILVYCNPGNPRELYEKFESVISEDHIHR